MSALDESPLIPGLEVLVRLTGANAPPLSGVLLGTTHGKINLRMNQWIEPASRVSATFANITLSGEVVYCMRKDTSYQTCIAMVSEINQRREPRIPVRQPGRIIILSCDGSESTEGTLLDLSASGMRLEMSHRVETGTMIFFVTESAAVAGEVRYCQQRRSGHFEAGVQITVILPQTESQQKSRQGPLEQYSR